MLVFKERGKPEYPEKNLSEQRREPTTNSTHIWRRRQDLSPGHIGGRRVVSPLYHPLLPLAHVADVIYPRVNQKLVSSVTQVSANPLGDNNFHKKYYLATIPLKPDACEDVTENTEEGNAFAFKRRPSSSSSIYYTHLPLIFTQLLQQVVRFLLYFHPT